MNSALTLFRHQPLTKVSGMKIFKGAIYKSSIYWLKLVAWAVLERSQSKDGERSLDN